jgi:hypothetical protein
MIQIPNRFEETVNEVRAILPWYTGYDGRENCYKDDRLVCRFLISHFVHIQMKISAVVAHLPGRPSTHMLIGEVFRQIDTLAQETSAPTYRINGREITEQRPTLVLLDRSLIQHAESLQREVEYLAESDSFYYLIRILLRRAGNITEDFSLRKTMLEGL